MTKLAVVTGGNKGIGFEICKKLGAAGVKVIVAARNDALGQEAADKLKGLSYDAEYRNLDIADGGSIDRFVASFAEDFGQLDILVNNAAIAFKTSDPTPYKDQAFATINPNFFGTVRLTELLLPVLHKSDAPRIVNVASQMGHLRILTSSQLKSRFLSAITVSEVDTLMREFVSSVEDGTHAEKGGPHCVHQGDRQTRSRAAPNQKHPDQRRVSWLLRHRSHQPHGTPQRGDGSTHAGQPGAAGCGRTEWKVPVR